MSKSFASSKRVVFMGTPDYATEILKALIGENSIKVVALFTQPDKPVGRKQILTPPHIKKYLLETNSDIEIFQPESLKDKEVQKELEKLEPDFIIVAAYGQLLPKEVLDIAPCINLHASLLPSYRGASPIQSSILNGDKFSGVTAMLMDEGLDRGDILAYSVVKIDDHVMVSRLFEELSKAAAKLTISVVNEFDKIAPIKQFDCLKSYSKKISKNDGLVDLDDAKKVYTKFRAFHPWPGIFLKNSLKIKSLELGDSSLHKRDGEILDIKDESVEVSCLVGSLILKRVQPPSKKEMSAKEYILGKRLKVGDSIF